MGQFEPHTCTTRKATTIMPPTFTSPTSPGFTLARRHVVVDVETTGLEPHHQVWEAAWYDLGTDTYDQFFLPHTLDGANEYALELTDYHTRIQNAVFDDGTKLRRMWNLLGGDGAKVTIWGANPGFDIRHLMVVFANHGLAPHPFHHRPMDPCAGAYWMFPDQFEFGETPGLFDTANFLGVPIPSHEALTDVFTTVGIIRKLNEVRAVRTRPEPTTGH